jgi:hypothetical protein
MSAGNSKILQHKIQSTGGINTTVDSGVLPETDLVTADNIQFTTSGARIKREGLDYLNTVPTVTHRSSSGTTRTLVFSSTLQATSPNNNKLVTGEKIVITSTGSESSYTGEFTVASITTTTVTNDTITYTAGSSLTESSTATSTLTVNRNEQIIGMHDYWYTDGSNAKQQLLVYATDNDKLYKLDSSDRREEISGGGISGSSTKVRFTTYNNKCIISFDDDAQSPLKYNPDDSANYQTLGGTPQDFSISFEYLGRLWTDDKDNPDRLHYSETGAHEVWQGSGDSGALDIVVGDGDNVGITAIFSYQGILYVSKGNRYFRILGNAPENFVIQEVTKGLGIVSSSTVNLDNRDVHFVSKRGIHSTSATDKYGDTETSFTSIKIQQLFDNFPPNLLDNIQGAYIPNLNSVAWAVPDKGSTYNNSIYLYNTELSEWYRWPDVEAISLTRRVVNGQFRLVWGDRNGRIIQAENGESTDFDTTGIVYRTKSGTIYPGNDIDLLKRFHYIKPIYKPTGNFEFTVICKIDNQSPQSVQFTQSASGTKWGDFVLGESVLGIDNTLQPFHETIEGMGRGITLEVVNSGSEEQVEIYGWIIGWEPAAFKAEVIGG